MNTPTSTEPPSGETDDAELLAEALEESAVDDSESEQAEPKKLSRFRRIYQRYRAKGKWFVVGFVVFYLIRDTILYILLPWYLAKGGVSVFDWLFED